LKDDGIVVGKPVDLSFLLQRLRPVAREMSPTEAAHEAAQRIMDSVRKGREPVTD